MIKYLYAKLILVSIIIILVTIFSISLFNITELTHHKKQDIRTVTEEYIVRNKDLVKRKVADTIYQIEYMRKKNIEDTKLKLKTKIDTLHTTLSTQYNHHKAFETKETIKKELLDIINVQNLQGKDKYIYVLDIKTGRVLAHGIKNFIGKDFSNKKDKRGTFTFKSKVEILKTKSSSFQEIYFVKPSRPNQEFKKLGYFKKFEPFDWIIGTGEYIEDSEKSLKKDISENLNEVQKDLKNYIFIGDIYNINGGKDFAKLLVMPNIPEKIGKFISDDKKDIKGNYFRKEYLRQVRELGEGFSNYWYKKPKTLEHGRKTTYVFFYKEWNWIIGCGFYYDELDAFIDKKEVQINEDIDEIIKNSIILAIITLLIASFFLYTFSKRITNKIQFINDKLKQRNIDLEMERTRYKNLMENSSDWIWEVDKNGVYTFVSDRIKDFLGYEATEIIGKTPFDLMSEEEAKRVAGEFIKYVSEQKSFRDLENTNIHKNGEFVVFETSGSPIYNENGEFIGYRGTDKDITEAKKLQKELTALNIGLEQKVDERTKEIEEQIQIAQNATKTKSIFLANMSHEIRTPMNGIIGMSHLALKTNLDEKQRNYLNKINLSANNLLGIINDILDISKIEAGKLKIEKGNFDLFKVIESVVNLVELKIEEKSLDVTVAYEPQVGKEFYGDSLRINQILTNLLSNAVKFTHSGEVGLVVSKASENRVRFEIKDTGIGLSKMQIERLFSSFTQADSTTTKKYGGTGLGLAISKELVELMNGKIWVESELGVGSRFIFEIELEKREKEKSYTMFTGKKVLIVDDCQSWLDILDHLMHSFGLNVHTVHSGKEAIAELKDKKDQYDLLLIDWNMPELDGIETCKIIEKELNIDSKKIILVSAYSKESLIQGIKEAHIDHYLHKPVNPSELNDILSEVFYGKRNLEKLKKSQEPITLQNRIKSLKGSHILLAEDNEVNQEIIVDLLENSGIIIDIAKDGLEAVSKTKKNRYELILMDIQMPHLDGYEACEQIREIDKDIPIIALTANAMKEDIEKTKAVGMNRHLNKPIEVEKLYETLLEFLSKKVESDEPYGDLLDNLLSEELFLPEFKTLDKEYALKLVLGNEKVFILSLKGILRYKDLNFEEMNDEDFKRNIHSLKGISGSAGAKDLFNIAEKIDKTLDKTLLVELYEELSKVVEEIELSNLVEENNNDKGDLSEEHRNELFEKLKNAVQSKRIKSVVPVIEELEKYNLSNEDKELFSQIKNLVNKFKFKQALELLS